MTSNDCLNKAYICQTENNTVLLLTLISIFSYNAPVTATPVVGIRTPLIQRRNSAVQALFLCLQFTLWQRAQESRQARRSLCSGSSNPAYTVALLLRTNGGSLQNLTKETVMSNHVASLHALSHETLLARIDALVTALEVANDHPQNLLLPSDHYIICQILHQHIAVLAERLDSLRAKEVRHDDV